MRMEPGNTTTFELRYRGALETYLEPGADETQLIAALELGKIALADEVSLLDLLAIHHVSLESLIRGSRRNADVQPLLAKAIEFLAQVAAPFEMAQRGWRDIVGQLRLANEALEERVAERTAALQASELERYLMKAERLSGLGSLVAGVAHELSTPIGNCLTVSTSLMRRSSALNAEVATGQLRRSRLSAFVDDNLNATGQLVIDLERAGGLIQSFSQVAVDRGGAKRRPFNLKLATEQIVTSLQPSLRKTQLSLAIEIPDSIVMDSYPGPYGQVLTNLVTNTAVHAFADRQGGQMFIQARALEEGQAEIVISDNGEGMATDVLQHAFDPFFTTRRSHGHAGLGLFIVHNIVTQQLGGRIALSSAPTKGTTFRITIPMIAPGNED
jgi:signal transduction histidine kinase